MMVSGTSSSAGGYRATVASPSVAGQDAVPGWCKRLARYGVTFVTWLGRRGLRLEHSRPLALTLLWSHALYVRAGQAIGMLTPQYHWARRQSASAESMVAIADPAAESM
jgi:hypothetical protein